MGLEPSALPAARAPRGCPLRGHLTVAEISAVGDRGRAFQHAPAERADQGPVERQIEAAPAPGEVLIELALDRLQPVRGFDDPCRDPRSEQLEHGLRILLRERQSYQPASRDRAVERPERRVNRPVSDVGEIIRHDPRPQARGRRLCFRCSVFACLRSTFQGVLDIGVHAHCSFPSALDLVRVFMRSALARACSLPACPDRECERRAALLQSRGDGASAPAVGSCLRSLARPSCSDCRAASCEQPRALAISLCGMSATKRSTTAERWRGGSCPDRLPQLTILCARAHLRPSIQHLDLRDRHRPAGMLAVGVDRLAMGDRQHPGLQVRAGAQPRVCLQCGDERLLEAVLGLDRAHRGNQKAPDVLAMAVEEALERRRRDGHGCRTRRTACDVRCSRLRHGRRTLPTARDVRCGRPLAM